MSTYMPDPADDFGLSAAAQALSAGRLENEVLLAEMALGLIGFTLDADDTNRAKTAVARQVNLQVRAAAQSDVVSESRGRQSVTYSVVNGQRVMVDALALQIAQAITQPPAASSATEADVRW